MLRVQVNKGAMPRVQAELLLGFVLFESLGSMREVKRATYWARCSDLDKCGLLSEGRLRKGGRKSKAVEVNLDDRTVGMPGTAEADRRFCQ